MATTVIEAVRERLGDPEAGSFQLMGEDLTLVTGPTLNAAAVAYEERLAEAVPRRLRERFEREQAELAEAAHRWLRRYNHSLRGRVRGYVELGRRCDFTYPWPVVAVLGICQVNAGLTRMRLWGLAGEVVARLGLDQLSRATDGIDDILRRTNRGIFADSVPTVLYALRCTELRRTGEAELAEVLLQGPLPPAFDEESRLIARRIVSGLASTSDCDRFDEVAQVTLRHFEREQAIFTHHLGSTRSETPRPSPSRLARWLSEPREVPAPTIEGRGRRRRLTFKPFTLPKGFQMRDHDARVRAFGSAFVESVTGSLNDHRIAVQYVLDTFGKRGERVRW